MDLARLGRALGLAGLALGSATRGAAQADTNSRWIALGVTTSITLGHEIREAGSDALIGETGSRLGMGFEIRGQLRRRIGITLTGEYLLKSGDGPLRDCGRAGGELDLFLNPSGAVRAYVGAMGGVENASYDGLSGGQPFEETRLALGPVTGALLRLGKRAVLGVSAEYLIGSSPYRRSFRDGGTGEPPKTATPGTLVVRARLLFITLQ